MRRAMLGLLRLIGRGVQNALAIVLAVSIIGVLVASADYLATVPGSGTTFASIVIATKHYAAMVWCDATAGESQCAAVSAAGAVKVDGSAVTQPVSGTVTANAGTNLNTSALATSANQTTANTSLSTIATNTGAQVPAGTNVIGAVTIPGGVYNTVAASQTAQAMTGGSGGATGDYLSHCVIYPVTTSPGVVTVFDNTSSAGNNAIAFAGGATSTSNLTPVSVPVGAFSVNGAWKVTTGTNVIVTCYGKFH